MRITKALRLNIVEGEHAGHNVVVDAWGIDFCGRDPETAGYCHTCREPLDVYPVEPPRSDGGRDAVSDNGN